MKIKHKFFNVKKYFLEQRCNQWISTTNDMTRLSHDTWNCYHPDDPILRGDGNIIHHKSGDSSDDRIENLQKMKLGEHSKLHNTGCHRSDDEKQKSRDSNLGKSHTDETKQKMSDAKLGHIVTDETKQKMRDWWSNDKREEKRTKNLGSKNPNWKS